MKRHKTVKPSYMG